MAAEPSLPCILDREFFKILSNDNGKVVAECVNCVTVNKKISGTLTSYIGLIIVLDW